MSASMVKRKVGSELTTGGWVDLDGPEDSRVEVSLNTALATVRVVPTGRSESREGTRNLNQPEVATCLGGSVQVIVAGGPGGQLVGEPTRLRAQRPFRLTSPRANQLRRTGPHQWALPNRPTYWGYRERR